MKDIAKRNTLTPQEATRLAELEPIIERGLKNFVDVGNALLEISDKRYYRQNYATFKAYVEAKYNISVSRAYQLCEAAEVVKALPLSVSTFVDSEAKARVLSEVSASDRPKIVRAAVKKAKHKGGRVTAPILAEVIEEHAPKAREPEPEEIDHDQALKAFELDVRQLVDAIPAGAPMAKYAMVLRVAARGIEETAMRAMGNPVQMNAYTR